MATTHAPLTHADLLQLKRWNTCTIYNGWEQITRRDAARDGVNREETHDFMPQMGPMIGYAVTVTIQPGEIRHRQEQPDAWSDFRRYVAGVPGPKIVVMQDLDKPEAYGSFWGEVSANTFRALGCVGTITDGAVRDIDEMTNAGFKALAQRLCVGHAHAWPVRWNTAVEVFGRTVQPGQLIHADKHGFLVIDPDEAPALLDAARFMDANECETVIPAARGGVGKSLDELLRTIDDANAAFGAATRAQFGRTGEW